LSRALKNPVYEATYRLAAVVKQEEMAVAEETEKGVN